MPTCTEFDSSLSLAMLKEALINPQIKLVLNEVAIRLSQEILPMLMAQEHAGLAPKLTTLAMQHSRDDKFVGAILSEYSSEYLEQTP